MNLGKIFLMATAVDKFATSAAARGALAAAWRALGGAGPCEKDRFCAVDFPTPVKAQAIRIAVKLRGDYSGGVLECRIK